MRGFDWRDLLYAFLGFLLPMIYLEIIKSDPDFPLTSDLFTKLVIHLLEYVIGGLGLVVGVYNTGKVVIKKVIWQKYGHEGISARECYATWIKS